LLAHLSLLDLGVAAIPHLALMDLLSVVIVLQARVMVRRGPIARTPRGGDWRLIGNARARDLTEAQLEEASRYQA
jgi:hypothetical protein